MTPAVAAALVAALGDWTSLVVAVTGAVGMYLAHTLGKRGQRHDERQQEAKTELEKRIASFDELESINDRLEAENDRLHEDNDRLRNLISEAEATGNVRLAQQAARCRSRLDDLIAAMSVLQGVVVSEVAKTQAGDAIEDAVRHIADDHPDLG